MFFVGSAGGKFKKLVLYRDRLETGISEIGVGVPATDVIEDGITGDEAECVQEMHVFRGFNRVDLKSLYFCESFFFHSLKV